MTDKKTITSYLHIKMRCILLIPADRLCVHWTKFLQYLIKCSTVLNLSNEKQKYTFSIDVLFNTKPSFALPLICLSGHFSLILIGSHEASYCNAHSHNLVTICCSAGPKLPLKVISVMSGILFTVFILQYARF